MLQGKLVLVTGSTSGIGEGIARAMAAKGARVVLNGFGKAEEIDALVAAISKEHQVQVFYNAADMTKPAEIEAMMRHFEELEGGIDILVNNAGIQHVSPIESFPAEKWDQIIAINLSSAFHTTKHVVASMKAKKWGRIINIASAHALVASPFKSAYVAAKHGIAGLTKTVSLEVAEHNITVNAICPGYVLTPLVEHQIPDTAKVRNISEDEVKAMLLSTQPTKKFVTVEEIAGYACFLCSNEAQSITGAILSIDGGWTAE